MDQTFFPLAPIEVVAAGISYGSGWFDVDISAYVPYNATAAIVCVYNQSSGAREWGIRKNGSTDNRFLDVSGNAMGWGIIGLDSDKKFEFKNYYSLSNDRVECWLVGYITGGVTMSTNGVLVSSGVGAGAWTDIDLSAYLPAGAIGAIFEVCATSGTTHAWGIRKKGSTDDRTSDMLNQHNQFCAIIGVDSNRFIQVYKGDAYPQFWLLGYITDGVTFFTDGKDFTPTLASTWQYTKNPSLARLYRSGASGKFYLIGNAAGGMAILEACDTVNTGVRGYGESQIGGVGVDRISNHAFVIVRTDGLRGRQFSVTRRKM
ncbi:MAG: hypothetical protein PHN44_04340 [Candidatus Marinimicrobia bacterium]|nr:hypothetical protein [Candidatus Neomarinimicrobiota bacterium]